MVVPESESASVILGTTTDDPEYIYIYIYIYIYKAPIPIEVRLVSELGRHLFRLIGASSQPAQPLPTNFLIYF